jgi:hypothetical protein
MEVSRARIQIRRRWSVTTAFFSMTGNAARFEDILRVGSRLRCYGNRALIALG